MAADRSKRRPSCPLSFLRGTTPKNFVGSTPENFIGAMSRRDRQASPGLPAPRRRARRDEVDGLVSGPRRRQHLRRPEWRFASVTAALPAALRTSFPPTRTIARIRGRSSRGLERRRYRVEDHDFLPDLPGEADSQSLDIAGGSHRPVGEAVLLREEIDNTDAGFLSSGPPGPTDAGRGRPADGRGFVLARSRASRRSEVGTTRLDASAAVLGI